MWKKLALALGALLLVLLALVAMQPSSFAVERSAEIEAPADLVFEQIQNPRAMDAWSPFVKMDPQLAITYEGPEAGVGARSSWRGPQMGEGRLTVTGVQPGREVEMRLEMLSPMPADNRIRFSLTPSGSATRVTWRMEGESSFVGKAIGLVVDMDAMVGGQFEQGLAALEQLAEAAVAGRVSPAGGRAS
jgi:uncharacterized protein YndB with AHSA1/START domain